MNEGKWVVFAVVEVLLSPVLMFFFLFNSEPPSFAKIGAFAFLIVWLALNVFSGMSHLFGDCPLETTARVVVFGDLLLLVYGVATGAFVGHPVGEIAFCVIGLATLIVIHYGESSWRKRGELFS